MKRCRYAYVLACLALCVGCASVKSWVGYEKVGAEFTANPFVFPEFTPGGGKECVTGQCYVDLEELYYRHPVSGQWDGLAKSLRGDDDEELALFVLLATYDDPAHLPILAEAFKRPLKVDGKRIDDNKHNWFSENFNLELLPDSVDVAYWLGYNGSAVPSSEPIGLGDFSAKGDAVRNGARLWPLPVTGGRYVYTKVIVLEETGHKRLRDLWDSLGGESDFDGELVLDVVKDLEKQDYLGVLTSVGTAAASELIEKKIDEDGIVDLEYYHESSAVEPTREIPLRHMRHWVDGDHEFSFEMALSLETTWAPPLGEEPLEVEDLIEQLNKR